MSDVSSPLRKPRSRPARLALLRKAWVSIPLALVLGYVVAALVLELFVATSVVGGQMWKTMSLPHPNLVGLGIVALVALAFHAVLWPREFARRARFSMRTLLVLVTVAAVVTSFAVVPYLRARAQRLAAERLDAAATFEDGKVVALELPPRQNGPGPLLDQKLDELRNLPDVRRLSLRLAWVTDAGLVHLAHLRRLESLDFWV
jgi:hypothetical protein